MMFEPGDKVIARHQDYFGRELKYHGAVAREIGIEGRFYYVDVGGIRLAFEEKDLTPDHHG